MKPSEFDTYLVGGYVRDHYLREMGYAIPEGDRDWVVVGATPEAMLAAGFLPVGKDFPVFLHPQTHEEYALARTERKVAPGYHGFTFHAASDVTLQEDLKRRDLTINAMAMKDGILFDPYGGLNDLKKKVIRHVSEAFKEDPVRILRVSRFYAKLNDFTIAPETLTLMRDMVKNGETDALVPERIFQELRKALMMPACDRFIRLLMACGLGEKLFAPLVMNEKIYALLTQAHENKLCESEIFATLTSKADSIEDVNAFLRKIRPNSEIIDLCQLVIRTRDDFGESTQERLALFKKTDAFRRPARLTHLLNVVSVTQNLDTQPWQKAFEAAASVNTAQIAAVCDNKKDIPARIDEARLAAIDALYPQ